MQRAQRRDAARTESYHFRRSIFPRGQELPHDEYESRPPSPRVVPSRNGIAPIHNSGESTDPASESTSRCSSPTDDRTTNGTGDTVSEEMTMNEIINGTVSSGRSLAGYNAHEKWKL